MIAAVVTQQGASWRDMPGTMVRSLMAMRDLKTAGTVNSCPKQAAQACKHKQVRRSAPDVRRQPGLFRLQVLVAWECQIRPISIRMSTTTTIRPSVPEGP